MLGLPFSHNTTKWVVDIPEAYFLTVLEARESWTAKFWQIWFLLCLVLLACNMAVYLLFSQGLSSLHAYFWSLPFLKGTPVLLD